MGVKQESLWYWIADKKTGETDLSNGKPIVKGLEFYSAFTVAELGEMWKKNDIDEPLPHIGVDGWYSYRGENEVKEKTEANARAKMLIFLLENKLTK